MSLLTKAKVVQSSDGTSIFAEAIGDPKNQSIVFAHGYGLSGQVWDNLFADDKLLRHFYLVRYDLRGHGRSGMPTDPESHSSSLYADDFAAVTRAFGLKSPVFVGWSFGTVIVADICANLDPLPISGAVYIGALPWIGPIMNTVTTPYMGSLIPGFMSKDDVSLSNQTKIKFIDGLFNEPAKVPIEIKWSWLGSVIYQPTELAQICLTHAQDPVRLLEAGSNGLPVLILHGTADKHQNVQTVIEEMAKHFKNIEVHMIEGGSHALFYESQEDVVDKLVSFVKRVTVSN